MSTFHVPTSNLRRIHLTLTLALVLVAALGIFFVREVVALQAAMDQLRDNDQARVDIRSVLVDLLDAETGQRGFILTGQESYLPPYYKGKNHIKESIRKAQQAAGTGGARVADFSKILLLAEQKLEELDRTVVLKKQGDNAGALAVVVGGYGKATMDEVRQLIQRNIEQLRLQRDQVIDRLDARLRRSAILLVLILATVSTLATHAWRSLSKAVAVNNRLAQTLSQEASNDALTGLPNRRFFDRWARQLVNRSRRDKGTFTLLLIDLDGFKKVNDTLGHQVGDDVLKEAARRLQAGLRGGELLARLGGDEFGLLIEGNVSRADLEKLGRRLIDSLSPRLHQRLADGAVGASIGVSCFRITATISTR
ncbi:putative diguanylate cyclase AdrA [Massilia sp. Bi118]|uniref:diguanylate cyclase domain-containing protein n=1 Tax=Massilia sp. Bi118 TaxID=2822346 RepID=UPI001D7820D1|nr:diguanylate cyclase [Massilia sp. Bi118]CAH0144202.1 putative diguanylate cyclase AdrA [Massilia sp. Bi118]